MKRLFLVFIMLFVGFAYSFAQDSQRKPEKLTLSLVFMADAGAPNQYVFVVNSALAYKTIDGLKNYLKNIPKGSTLTWAPGCERMGNEPLLSSQDEMLKFKEFCRSIGINFVLVPSG